MLLGAAQNSMIVWVGVGFFRIGLQGHGGHLRLLSKLVQPCADGRAQDDTAQGPRTRLIARYSGAQPRTDFMDSMGVWFLVVGDSRPLFFLKIRVPEYPRHAAPAFPTHIKNYGNLVVFSPNIACGMDLLPVS